MNKVLLVGRLTAKPELRYTGSNVPYVRFTVAANRGYNSQQGQPNTDFIGCVAWRRTAENIANYLDKGSMVSVQGYIQTGSYNDKDGNRRYTTDVVADNVQFLSSRSNNTDNTNNTSTQDSDDDFTLSDDDIGDVDAQSSNANDNSSSDNTSGDAATDSGSQDTGSETTDGGDSSGTSDTSSQDSGGDSGDSGDGGSDGSDENFDINADAGGDDAGGGTEGGGDAGGTGDGGDQGQDQGSSGNTQQQAPADPTDGIKDQEQKEAEEQLYDTLTDEQKRIRTLELKVSFSKLYEESDTIINAINGIPKNNDNIDTIRRLSLNMDKVKKYIVDYLTLNFDYNSYIDNYATSIKFLAIMDTVKKILNELSKQQKIK